MNFEAIEVAPFAGLLAAMSRVAVDFAAPDPIVVANSNGETVNDVDVVSILFLGDFAQQVEQCQELVLDAGQAATQTTAADDQMLEIALLAVTEASHRVIAMNVQRCHHGNRHHFGVAQRTLWIITMMLPFQQVVHRQ